MCNYKMLNYLTSGDPLFVNLMPRDIQDLNKNKIMSCHHHLSFILFFRVKIYFVFLLFIAAVESRGSRKPSAMNDDTYKIIVRLLEGSFDVPCAQRTTTENNAISRFYRNQDRYSLQGHPPELLLDGKKVLRKSELTKVVSDAYFSTKGAGARRLNYKLKNNLYGLSERSIHNVLSSTTTHRRMNVRFTNKAPYIPVVAKQVMERLQIDLVNMKPGMKYRNKKYKYILTVIDVFSRYIWLKPLQSKSSDNVARPLSEIFQTFGQPKFIQHDQGTEFKSKVKRLLEKLGVQDVTSAPYHPQSQGKIERSHRSLRSKIHFDLITKKPGVNWVRELPKYEKIMNNEPKEVLGWLSPFTVFFDRYPNNPKDVKSKNGNKLQNSKIREKAYLASKYVNRRTLSHQQRRLKLPIYELGDKVLIRAPAKISRVCNKMTVLEGTITGRNLKKYKYKVNFSHPTLKRDMYRWFSVADITGITLAHQKQRERVSFRRKKHRSNLYFTLDQQSQLEHVENDFSLSVRYNPPGDGNCQFSAVADQLETIGIHRSHETLRAEVIRYLERQPSTWSSFITESSQSYLTRMVKDGTYGDHITLQAISDIYNIQILIVSTLNQGTMMITPWGRTENLYSFEIPVITVGHLAEGNGEHYVSIESNRDQIISVIQNSVQISFDNEICPDEGNIDEENKASCDDENRPTDDHMNSYRDDNVSSHMDEVNSFQDDVNSLIDDGLNSHRDEVNSLFDSENSHKNDDLDSIWDDVTSIEDHVNLCQDDDANSHRDGVNSLFDGENSHKNDDLDSYGMM